MMTEVRAATVLLVEDNPADQNLGRRALEKGVVKCNLRIAADGEEALDSLSRRGSFEGGADHPPPDLVLLDLNMPRIDGLQVLKSMKSDPRLCTIPVVVLTTSDQEEDIVRSYRLGCNSFVRKPLNAPDFLVALQSLKAYWLKLVVLPRIAEDRFQK